MLRASGQPLYSLIKSVAQVIDWKPFHFLTCVRVPVSQQRPTKQDQYVKIKCSYFCSQIKCRPLISALCQKTIYCSVFDFTSVVVLDISAGSFHRGVAASAPPAQLAYTIPAIVTQSAPTISVAQTRTALCVTKLQKERDE